MYKMAFALGVGLTAFGGAVILPYVTVFPGVGSQFVVLMFTVVVLGGLGSIAGAVVGGLTVGVIQALSSLFFPIQLQNLVLFVVFILVLAVRPQGLIGAKPMKRLDHAGASDRWRRLCCRFCSIRAATGSAF